MIFQTNPKEAEKVIEFCERHRICHGGFVYKFLTGSGIGVSVKVECRGCGAETDATDYNCW